jgi:predicted acetyltransferase
VTIDVRLLTDADDPAARRLGGLAFGYRDTDPRPAQAEGQWSKWGGFDHDGRLVATATDLHHEQWWGGRVVPASGIASVAVAPERRGQGATRAVLTAVLHGARDRGAFVANLFCTSAAVYRALGFEVASRMPTVSLPTDALSRAPLRSIRLRPGTGRDWPLLRTVYDEIARNSNGMLSRRGRLFEDPEGEELPDGIDVVTIATDDAGEPLGYVSYHRGRGYDDTSVITVYDCLALHADAARALLATVASWGTVAPSVRLRLLPWHDAVNAVLPVERVREHKTEIWMHRPVDVVAATAARGWPVTAAGTVSFRLVDRELPWNDGLWRLVVEGGEGALAPSTEDTGLVLDVRGWSVLWCGAGRAAQLRQSGLLTGGERTLDAPLDALLGCGPPAGAYDYF